MEKIVFTCGSSSFATALKNSIGTITGATVSADGSTVTITYTTPVDSLVIAKLTAQVQVKTIAVTTTTTVTTTATCKHGTNLSEATCSAQAVCIDCEQPYGSTIAHATVSEANCTDKAVCSVCGEYGEVNTNVHDITAAATCKKPTQCSRCGDVGEVDLIDGHDYDGHTCKNGCGIDTECVDTDPQDNICDICNKTLVGEGQTTEIAWKLVTNVNDLSAGDKIIIVAKDYNYALSTTQNSNNRGQVAITKNGDIVTIVDAVQLLTLEAGTASGSFAFNTGSGYLYAASSSANHLKTQATNNENSSWKITIASDGTATIVAQGSYTRNTMQYNQSSSLFACYASASQKALTIYKQTTIVVCDHTGGSATCTEQAVCTRCEKPYGELADHNYPANSHDCTYGCGEKSECVDADPQDNVCDICQESMGGTTEQEPTTVTFTLGANGSASHGDGTSASSYTETVDGYKLNITGGTNMYTGARDAKGNSCLKLGSSKNAGSFSFTVPNDVTKVIIYVAKYKSNTTKVTINGGAAQTLTQNSNDGNYDAFTIDTTTNKTITFATASGGIRCMVNTIEFVIE